MSLSIFAHCSIFSGLNSLLTGSSQYFRGVLNTYGHAVIIYGEVFVISGNEKIVYKVSGTNYNSRGIFPHMDSHRRIDKVIDAVQAKMAKDYKVLDFFLKKSEVVTLVNPSSD